MRTLGSLLYAVIAGIITYLVVIPVGLVLALMILALGLAAAIGSVGAMLSFIGWLIPHDPAALRAATKCAVYGCAAFLPSFLMGYLLAGLRERRHVAPTLEASFEEVETQRPLRLILSPAGMRKRPATARSWTSQPDRQG